MLPILLHRTLVFVVPPLDALLHSVSGDLGLRTNLGDLDLRRRLTSAGLLTSVTSYFLIPLLHGCD